MIRNIPPPGEGPTGQDFPSDQPPGDGQVGPRETPRTGVHRHTPEVHSHHRHHQHHAQSADKYSAPQPTGVPDIQTRAPTQATRAPTEATRAPTEATRAPTQATQAPTEATRAPTQATQAPTEATKEDLNEQIKKGRQEPPIKLPLDQNRTFNPDIKGDFLHTDPDDKIYQPEEMKKWFERTGGEKHLSGYNFLGPKTLFALRNIGGDGDFYKYIMERAGLEPVGSYPYNEPINDLDRAAFEHDRVFSDLNATVEQVREADIAFIEKAKNIEPGIMQYIELQLAGGPAFSTNRYAQEQLAANSIRLKVAAEDAGLVREGLFSQAAQREFVKAVYGRNETLPKDIDHASFWGWVVDSYFRGTKWLKEEAKEAGLTTGVSVGITLASRLAQRRRIPYVGSAIDRLINFMARRLTQNPNPEEFIRGAESILETISEQVVQSWFDDWGNVGELAQIAGRYGVREVVMALIDKLPDWIALNIKSEDWVNRGAITEEDIKETMRRRPPDGVRRGDLSISETAIFRDAMRDIANQTPAQRIRNVLTILRTIRDSDPTLTSKLSGIRKALDDGKVFYKINILRGTTTMQVIRSILRERVPPTIVQMLKNLFKDAFQLYDGENDRRFLVRLGGMTYAGLISQMAMLREFSDLLK